MRQGRNGLVILTDNGQLLAFNLGADYCAEHEWGVKGLNRAFGIREYDRADKTDAGLARRTITLAPVSEQKDEYLSGLFLVEKKGPKNGFTALVFDYLFSINRLKNAKTFTEACKALSVCGSVKPDQPRYGESKDFLAAWDEKSFGIIARHPDVCGHLRSLYEAAKNLDMSIGFGGGGSFKNSGLVLSIPSRWPAEAVQRLKEVDEESAQLYIDWTATGLEEKIRAAGLGCYGILPRRDGNAFKVWINPHDQKKYESRWNTMEELELWIKGEGPMIRGGKS